MSVSATNRDGQDGQDGHDGHDGHDGRAGRGGFDAPGGGAPRGRRRWAAAGAAALLVLVAVVASLLLGSNLIDPMAVLRRLADRSADTDAVVWGSRVPRTALGLMVGLCLGCAGAVMQGQTRNPLADPGIFGVSAGASLAVVLGARLLGVTSMIATIWFALAGAMAATVVVFLVAALGRGLSSPVPLAIAGTAVSTLLVAVTSFLVITDEATLAAWRIWVIGSLSGRTLDGVGVALACAAVGLVFAAAGWRSLNSLALGAELARGLGENLIRARLVGLCAITFLTASAVAVTGPIGFVGLTAPHIARAGVGGDHRWLIPVSGLVGAGVLLSCDVVGRLLGDNSETPVGVVLSVLGGAAFVAIVRRVRLARL
ncbi:MAG: iron ABC transporter permease [Bifidobacteriaceae bacterium]|jgi:iron complex transport system permease protein|nr:iron ABC transporter permease [Bifidobacteriaceae bacterium]